jgi:hypothetical protein
MPLSALHRRRAACLAEWLLYALLAAAALRFTWLAWTDLFVDFGHELYTAWMLSEGKTLYLDVARYFGPLSSHVNALWFRLVGPSIHHLYALNFLVWLAVLAALRHILSRIASPLARVVGLSCFILFFSFVSYSATPNDNYLSPYVHEITHGFLLSLLALMAVDAALRRDSLPLHALTGALTGLLLQTKPEVALAGCLALAAAYPLAAFRRMASPPRLALAAGTALLAALAILAATLFLLSLRLPFRTSADALLLPWKSLFNPVIRAMPYFAFSMGTDDLPANLRCLLFPVFPLFLALHVALLAINRVRLRRFRLLLALLPLAFAVYCFTRVDYRLFPRSLPLFVLLALFLALFPRTAARLSRTPPAPVPLLRVLFLVFAFALLLKILFFVRIWHYGFVLAAPAFLCTVALLLDWLPALQPDPVFRRTAQALALLFWFLFAFVFLRGFRETHAEHPVSCSVRTEISGDAFFSDDRTPQWNAMEAFIRETVPPDATLASFPAAAMMNYILRIPSSIPFATLAPPEFAAVGEPAIFSSLRKHSPDYILYVNTDTSFYGVPFFGLGYAQNIFAWILLHYDLLHAEGPVPFASPSRGLALYRRKSLAPR